MAFIRRRTAKRLFFLGLTTFLSYHLLKLILPPDNPLLLAIHWLQVCLSSLLTTSSETDTLILSSPGPHPADFTSRVGILVKTGYGTRERLPAQLEALGLGEWDPKRVVVVGDFAREVKLTGGTGIVRDAVGELTEYLTPMGLENEPRLRKYRALWEAIKYGHEEAAQEIGANVGWELDALKFIWGLDTLYTTTPLKDWYLILDDDSYVIPQTLTALLSHLDPSEPHYLGNTVGDYRGRFAHGGSVILLSRGTVDALFRRNPSVARAAHVEALTEKWGDKLVATTMQKLGVFIDERFNHMFNGESPRETRIWGERFCSPLVGFHELKRPEDMREAGEVLGGRKGPVLWSDVWGLFGGEDVWTFVDEPARKGRNFVGTLKGDAKGGMVTRGVRSAEGCRGLCMRDRRCLAWSWKEGGGLCRTAPWMVVGGEAEGIISGIMGDRAAELMRVCKR